MVGLEVGPHVQNIRALTAQETHIPPGRFIFIFFAKKKKNSSLNSLASLLFWIISDTTPVRIVTANQSSDNYSTYKFSSFIKIKLRSRPRSLAQSLPWMSSAPSSVIILVSYPINIPLPALNLSRSTYQMCNGRQHGTSFYTALNHYRNHISL